MRAAAEAMRAAAEAMRAAAEAMRAAAEAMRRTGEDAPPRSPRRRRPPRPAPDEKLRPVNQPPRARIKILDNVAAQNRKTKC